MIFNFLTSSALVLLIFAITSGRIKSWRIVAIRSQHRSHFQTRTALAHRTRRPLFSRLSMVSAAAPDLSDDELGEILDDIIYSGDIEGSIRKRIRDLMNDNFLGFVEEKMEATDDADEKTVLKDIVEIIEDKIRAAGGSDDNDADFEKRLDKILFTPPNKRRAYIDEIKDDLSPAFMEYVKLQLKDNEDTDIKIVMATVLQILGDSTGSDLLGRSKALLHGADETLGEEYAKKPASDILEMGGLKPGERQKGSVAVGERNEQILAALIFSKNDILEDVLNNLHEINEEFLTWLQEKIDGSKDMEERVGLSSLRDTISSVLLRVREAEQESDEDFAEEELTIDQVKQRMQQVQMGAEFAEKAKAPGAAVFRDFELMSERRDTFLSALSRFRNLPPEISLKEAVVGNYELCDKDFLDQLQGEIDDCMKADAVIEAQEYQLILATINQVMSEKIGSAQERLQQILQKGNPMAMASEVALMTRRGQMDEALVLLMEANAQMARDAGALDAAEVLEKLVKRVYDERDRLLPDEQRLLRALFKLDDSEQRKALLFDAFKQTKITDAQGGLVDGGPPLIAPPAFIKVVRDFVTKFGNVEKFQVMEKAKNIIDEAETVATELYGQGMSPREQQQFMFEKKTLSVWDLANFEEQAMMSGEDVPWRNDKYDTMNPEDVVGERVKKIGGMDGDL